MLNLCLSTRFVFEHSVRNPWHVEFLFEHSVRNLRLSTEAGIHDVLNLCSSIQSGIHSMLSLCLCTQSGIHTDAQIRWNLRCISWESWQLNFGSNQDSRLSFKVVKFQWETRSVHKTFYATSRLIQSRLVNWKNVLCRCGFGLMRGLVQSLMRLMRDTLCGIRPCTR